VGVAQSVAYQPTKHSSAHVADQYKSSAIHHFYRRGQEDSPPVIYNEICNTMALLNMNHVKSIELFEKHQILAAMPTHEPTQGCLSTGPPFVSRMKSARFLHPMGTVL
jgi:hypothetical protein